jgi:RNA polymerase sigma-70 factor (ECF subfamily)
VVDPFPRRPLDAALVRLKAGDRQAASDVFRLAWPPMRAFARRWLRGSPQADDVAQEALVKVFAQAPDFDASRDALAWVLEVTVWECRSERARVRRRGEVPEAPLQAAMAPDPQAAVEAEELRRALEEATAGLPEGDRREVARVLAEQAAGDPAARKRRQRALERLQGVWRRLHGA